MTTPWMGVRHQSCVRGVDEWAAAAGVADSTRATGAQKYLASSTARRLTRRQWAATSVYARREAMRMPAIDSMASGAPTPTLRAAIAAAIS